MEASANDGDVTATIDTLTTDCAGRLARSLQLLEMKRIQAKKVASSSQMILLQYQTLQLETKCWFSLARDQLESTKSPRSVQTPQLPRKATY